MEVENGNGDRDILLCINKDEFVPLNAGFSSPVYNDSAVYDAIEEQGWVEDETMILN
jgi:hypothetical protein